MPPASFFLRGTICTISTSRTHTFSKTIVPQITLTAGIGMDGDVHSGATMRMPTKSGARKEVKNKRQVHLIASERIAELNAKGFHIEAGQLGENFTTQGLDLMSLPLESMLKIGSSVEIVVTGQRNPCATLEKMFKEITKEMLFKNEHGQWQRKAGIFGVVVASGEVATGDAVKVLLPPEPHLPLPVL
jgi:MOSC domain-containing protein YiiM